VGQAPQLPGFLPVRCPWRRSGSGEASAAHGGRGTALRKLAPGAWRLEICARAHVRNDLAYGPSRRHLAWTVVCRPVRGPDPTLDQRGPTGDAWQPQGGTTNPPGRGGPAPAVDELQCHDQGT